MDRGVMKSRKSDIFETPRKGSDEAQSNRGPGVLFVVSTPIGNLEDITLRALKVLGKVDIIAAENVGYTRGLCEHFGIKTRLTRYNQHNQRVKTPDLIRQLKSGRTLALVTDAGTPGISDPGIFLIHRAAEEGIIVTPVPGPSAVIAALSVSGFQTAKFVFIGFLPNRSGKRKRVLRELLSERRTAVFFEAPHRIKAALSEMQEILGDRRLVLVREMTKVFEEFLRGTAGDILSQLDPDGIKGEISVVIQGAQGRERSHLMDEKIEARIKGLLANTALSVKDIAARIADEEDLAYRHVYKKCLVLMNESKKCEKGCNINGAKQEV
jgi:16S rRNA (cytidine1402-2'-O)-methyltransferase